MAASDGDTQRIHDVAERLLAADADLRNLSWTKVQDIANALSVKKLRGSERRRYARELQVIAATNLAVAARLEGSDDRRAMQDVARQVQVPKREERPDERAAGSRVSSDADAQSHPHADEGASATTSTPTDGASVVSQADADARRQDRTVDASQKSVLPSEPDRSSASEQPADENDRDKQGAAENERANAAATNPNFDDRGRWTGDTAPMNVVQMINAEMVFQSEDERDKDRYAAAAAQASLYDDPVSVVLPSAEELEAMLPTVSEMAAVEDEELKREVAAEHRERERARLSDTDRTPVAKPGTPGKPGAGGTKPADPKPAEGEPSISFGVSEHSRTERAVLAEKERKEAKKARKRAKRAERRMKRRNADESAAEHEVGAGPTPEEQSELDDAADGERSASRDNRAAVVADAAPSAVRQSVEGVSASPEYASVRLQGAEEYASDSPDAAGSTAVSGDQPSARDSHSESVAPHALDAVPSHSTAADAAHDKAPDAQGSANEPAPRKSHRFKLFGRRNAEDLPVIPRGKSTYAPDDLFVIDKHRAAQAASAQNAVRPDDAASSAVEEGASAAGNVRHRPEHARSSTGNESSAAADETEGAR